jgi:hypothetical protein
VLRGAVAAADLDVGKAEEDDEKERQADGGGLLACAQVVRADTGDGNDITCENLS